ncbi:MAG: hypothetical protein ACLFRG_09690 [Desulfococcaceae bacterium]
MPQTQSKGKIEPISMIPDKVPEEITEKDHRYFHEVVSVELNERQIQQATTPSAVYRRQERVLAVHWHPEFIPMRLIKQRVEAMFPNCREELIIPTQHNEILSWNGYSGVEVDCYSSGFNQKVQLLLHFETEKVAEADRLREMLAHTFKYRSSQLFEFLHTLTRPVPERLEAAARQTGAAEALVSFVQIHARKIERLLDEYIATVPAQSIKNKLLRNFFDCLRADYGDPVIDRAQTFLKAVKKRVKADFPLQYFYRTREIIEEARSLNAGIVIPHPEQFWPVLLAGYDVDGIEVWNPQSHRYTKFLVSVLTEQNRERPASQRPLLVFMGDDTHMGEKVRDPKQQNIEKASREIGLQPAWDDLVIRKSLILANSSRGKVMAEYKSRLAG